MRKVEAAVLVVLLVLAGVFLQVNSKADDDTATNTVSVLSANAISLVAPKTSTELEIGDTVEVQIKATNLTAVTNIRGRFVYNTDGYFKALNNTNIESASGWQAVIDQDTGDVSIVSLADGDEELQYAPQTANGVLATITLTVKKAVKVKTTFRLTDVTVWCESETMEQSETTVIQAEVSNSMEGKRTVTFEMDDVEAHSGEVISVPVRIKDNTGFNAVGLRIEYSPTYLDEPTIELSDAMKSYVDCTTKYVDSGRVSLALVKAGNDFTKENVDFFTINFPVKENVGSGNSIPVTVTIKKIENVSGTSIVNDGAASYSSNISIVGDYLLGDVNFDGNRDLIDATFVLQYYNGIRDFTATQRQVADVNKSGSVTLVDVLLIMRSYNGETVIN